MQPFYTAFWRDIIPRSQEMVVQTILLDAKTLVDKVVEDVQERRSRINKLQASLVELQQKAGKITNEMLRNVNGSRESSAKEFRRLQDQLITRVQQECTTWTDYEPYTVCIEGIFVNDYVVRYREIERWYWENEKVNQAHEWVATKAENIMGTFVDQCQEIFQSISESLEQLNATFKNQNKDAVDESDLNSIAQHLMVATEFRDLIESSRSYFWGAMNHGGVHPVSWIISMDKSESRPSASRITDLVKGLLPLDRLIHIMSDHEDFEKSIKTSVDACYKWLEEEISKQSRQTVMLIEELQKAKGYL
jgi:hypothetical protein